jgi:hypothetical protein
VAHAGDLDHAGLLVDLERRNDIAGIAVWENDR